MLRKTIFQLLFTLFGMTILGISIQAQETGLPDEEVEVIKNFDAKLKQVERLKIVPVLPAIDTSSRNLTYFIPEKDINLEYAAPKIRPLAIKGEKPDPTYPGYIKAGYGTPSSPYGEFKYSNIFNEQFRFGAEVKHHSADYKDLEHQKFSNSSLGLSGTYYKPEGYAINGRAKYNVNEVYHYGYDHSDTSFSESAVKQQFKILDIGGSLFNNKENIGDLNYDVGFDFYSLKDNFASKETGIVVNLSATKWVADRDPIDLRIRADFTSFRDTTKQNFNNFYINPSYTFHGGAVRIKAGINLVSQDDDFKFYPDVEGTINVSGSQFLVFGGVEGSLIKNTYRNLTTYNPFLVSQLRIQNTEYIEAYGGIKGSFKQFNYEGKVGFKKAKGLPLYLPDVNDTKRFNVIYDTVDIVGISGTVGAELIPGMMLSGTISQNIFSLDNEEKAWHLPSTELNVNASYITLEDKLLLRADLYVANGVPYKNALDQTDNLKALLDLSVGGEYRVTDGVGVFLQANNLTNNKRERWQRYPTFGLNVLGGIVARF
ncbi:MAG: hypothetical protein KJP00_16400 [Bacteroidia bacterium]|nr:hypothetical protein [Bacteroidia bacterium]